MTRHKVCHIDRVARGSMTPISVGKRSLLVTRLPTGEVKAVGSRCPHHGANLEHACLTGHVHSDRLNYHAVDRPGQILRCPWHGFEFDLTTGMNVAGGKLRLRQFVVEVENDEVYVLVP